MIKLGLLALSILATQAIAAEPPSEAMSSSEPKDRYTTVAFNPLDDAQSQLARKRDDAKITGKKLLIIMGANWCHDSAALANLIDTPSFADMVNRHYEVLFVDVGTPQIGQGRNLDIARQFGIKKVRNTPLVLIVSPEGSLLNSKKDAIGWRNAASRSDEEIYRYLTEFKSAQK